MLVLIIYSTYWDLLESSAALAMRAMAHQLSSADGKMASSRLVLTLAFLEDLALGLTTKGFSKKSSRSSSPVKPCFLKMLMSIFTGRPEAWPAELPLEEVVLLADLNGTEVGKGVHVSQCHVGNSNTIESMHTITECTHFLAYPAT